MSLDSVIREALKRCPTAPGYVAARIAKELTPEQVEAYFVELLAARINDILRINAADARNTALNDSSGRSWKHGQGRSPWQRMCDSEVLVNGRRKRTGACNRDDLLAMINVRRTQVEHLNNQIDNFERLIKLLDQHDVTFVDDIPEGVLV